MPSTVLAANELLERYAQLRSGREKPGRFWRVDVDAIAPPDDVAPYRAPVIEAGEMRGGFALDLRSAQTQHARIFERSFGGAVPHREKKFAALACGLCNTGALVYVPAGVDVAQPIRIGYGASSQALFPITLVVVEDGARCTIVESYEGADASFVCGITEVFAGERAQVDVVSLQGVSERAKALFTRGAKPAKDSRIGWHVAHLGAELSLDDVNVRIEAPGVDAAVNALFFPRGRQHVDVVTTIDHLAGESQSQTLVKSAATGSGQARFLGTIRIAPHAQKTQSQLRDDALLLSKSSHIDSVPALEIAANDVKAYHGATVGALDDEQVFYMLSRGIERSQAERMIALGFFEPVVDRFPTEELREALRRALEAKVST